MRNKSGVVIRGFEKIGASRSTWAEGPRTKEKQLNEARYRAIIENQTELVITFQPNFKISFVNEAMCQYFGSSRAEIQEENLLHFVVEEDVDTVISAIRTPVSGSQRGTVVRVRNVRGEVCWTEWNGKAIFDGNRVLEYHVVGRDITDRKKMEDALIKSEANFRKLAEASPVGIYIFQDGAICYANSALLNLTGYCKEEIIGRDPFNLLTHPDSTAIIRENSIVRLQGENISPYKVRLVGRNGEDIWGYLSADIIDYESRPAIVGVIIDVTKSLKLEEEILKASQLKSLGVLAGGIAHDFNNILTVIAGNTSIAKTRYYDRDDALELLDEIETATSQARTLTQQLLTFSKGGVPVKETASIKEVIKESAMFVLRGSNVRCEFNIPDDLWTVDIDKGQINQVISNLIINADQAMPEGGVLRVSAENIEVHLGESSALPARHRVSIAIEDQGIGIPEGYLEKIFDPYFTTKQQGHGLGLATSYSIIKRHGGDIQVESQVGIGTKFTICIPALVGHRMEESYQAVRPVPGQGNILIMDDEEQVRLTLGRMLVYLGYTVEYAVDGVEALERYVQGLISKKPFDAVIMDLTIPGQMGGKEAVWRLLAIDPGAKVIVTSGYSNDPVMEDHTARGFCGVITKPCDLVKLSKVLGDALKR